MASLGDDRRIGAPGPSHLLRALARAAWIVRACNQARGEGERLHRHRRKAVSLRQRRRIELGRGDEKRACGFRGIEQRRRMHHGEDAAAVGDQHGGPGRGGDGGDDALHPVCADGPLPVGLLDAARRLEVALPAGLPVVRSRVGPAGHDQDVDVGGAHQPVDSRSGGRDKLPAPKPELRIGGAHACLGQPELAAHDVGALDEGHALVEGDAPG